MIGSFGFTVGKRAEISLINLIKYAKSAVIKKTQKLTICSRSDIKNNTIARDGITYHIFAKFSPFEYYGKHIKDYFYSMQFRPFVYSKYDVNITYLGHTRVFSKYDRVIHVEESEDDIFIAIGQNLLIYATHESMHSMKNPNIHTPKKYTIINHSQYPAKKYYIQNDGNIYDITFGDSAGMPNRVFFSRVEVLGEAPTPDIVLSCDVYDVPI